jgi:hypothetical protein
MNIFFSHGLWIFEQATKSGGDIHYEDKILDRVEQVVLKNCFLFEKNFQ